MENTKKGVEKEAKNLTLTCTISHFSKKYAHIQYIAIENMGENELKTNIICFWPRMMGEGRKVMQIITLIQMRKVKLVKQ